MSVYTDAVDATFAGWRIADGTPGGSELTAGQKAALTDLLRISGFEDFLASNQAIHRSWLAPGSATNKIPVFWSGKFTGSERVSARVDVFKEAMSAGDTVAFDIGNTEWGKFVDNDANAQARFAEAAGEFRGHNTN